MSKFHPLEVVVKIQWVKIQFENISKKVILKY